MNITDRPQTLRSLSPRDRDQLLAALVVGLLLVFPLALKVPVSYTHLTLPTKRDV